MFCQSQLLTYFLIAQGVVFEEAEASGKLWTIKAIVSKYSCNCHYLCHSPSQNEVISSESTRST